MVSHLEGMALVAGGLMFWVAPQAATGPVEIFGTGFEPPEYEVGFTLAEQDGWVSDSIGGNQVFEGYFPSLGQHGLVGFSKPEGTNATVSVWQPLNVDPMASGNPIVSFTVVMSIADSTDTSRRDSFRWSVYNTNSSATRLFSLDFDNATLAIAYLLDDDQGFVEVPFSFERDGLYDLAITMDFAANQWSAQLNDAYILTNQPITTVGSALQLGDIDAVWVRAAANAEYGDNFMVFDEYRVRAAPVPAPHLGLVERRGDGTVVVRVEGMEGQQVVLEASADLVTYTPLFTNTIPSSGSFTRDDATAAGMTARFYRGRTVP